jgi:short-subunit dehydrogenase
MSDASSPVAVVTGASSGIGAATARALAAMGTTIVAVARRTDLLERVVADCRRTAPASRTASCDLRDVEAAQEVVDRTVARFGRLDALVCIAGMPMRRRLESLRLAEVDEVMGLNFSSPVAMTLAALPTMLSQRRGTIVLVSSLVGRLGNGGEAAYSASKFALCGFAESASVDLAGSGVEVRLVLPGPIDTAMWDYPGQDPSAYEGERFAPELVADAIVAALSSTQIEHYVPDLKAIVELKTTDFQGFRDGMVAALRGDAAVELPGDEP